MAGPGLAGGDDAARNQLGLGNLAVSYVTKGIAIMRSRGDCLRAASAGSVAGGQQQFCQESASIARELRALPKAGAEVRGAGEVRRAGDPWYGKLPISRGTPAAGSSRWLSRSSSDWSSGELLG